MNESFIKDIVYDLIESKLKIKELEDKLARIEVEKKELTDANVQLNTEVNKWKTQVLSYINDYRDIYVSNTTEIKNEVCNEEPVETVTEPEVNNVIDIETEEDNKKPRSEYMKEYMRNKRKKAKEELKKVIVNKK